MIYEAYLHQYFNVKLNNNFWNESNQTPFGFDTTGKHFCKDTIVIIGVGRIQLKEYNCKIHKTPNAGNYKTSVSCIYCHKLFSKNSTHFKYCKLSDTRDIKPNNGNFIKVLDILTFTSSIRDKRVMSSNFIPYRTKMVVIKRENTILNIMTKQQFNCSKHIPYNSLKKTSMVNTLIEPKIKNQHTNKIKKYKNCYIEEYTLRNLSNIMLQYLYKETHNDYNIN